jgi:hemolysin activation/secretion protein
LGFQALTFLVALMMFATSGHFAHSQDVPKFPIVRFNVEGNFSLPQAEVEAAVRPFIGPQQDFGDVQQALEALEALFSRRGFSTVSVQLPEQVLDKGEVLLRVVEGRLREVKISGQQFFNEDNIRAALPTLKPGVVPVVDDISANLRIANENPTRQLTLSLAPGERDEDIDAIVRVTDERPWKLGMTLDNTGTNQTGKRRLGLMFQHANLWNRDHILTYQYQTSPEKPDDVKVHALAYRIPLYSLGDAIDFFATESNVNAGTIPAGPINLAISGSGVVFGSRYTLNLKRQGNYDHKMLFGLDYKAFNNNIDGGGLQLGGTITVHPLSAQYNGAWQNAGSELSVLAGINYNIPGGKNGRQDDFSRARVGAPDDFYLFRGGLIASHTYKNDWQVRFSSSAQWADQPLIPGEQFGIGGGTSVRGFQEREISNDKGVQVSLELYTPEMCARLGGDHRCRLLGFVDSGAVYRIDALPGEQAREDIASTGLGLRYSWSRHISFQTDYGYVLRGGGSQSRGDWRLHARMGLIF